MGTHQVEAPVCRVLERTAVGAHMTLSPGAIWFARGSRLFRLEGKSDPIVVRQEIDSIAGIAFSHPNVWYITERGRFGVLGPDGTIVASGTLNRQANSIAAGFGGHICIVVDHQEVISLTLSPPSSVTAKGLFRIEGKISAVVSVDHRYIFSVASNGFVDGWDLVNQCDSTHEFGDITLPIAAGDTICSARAFAELSDCLWCGTRSGDVVVVRLRPFQVQQLARQHAAAVTDFTVFADGQRVWSSSEDGSVVVWSATGEPIGCFQTGGTGIHAFCPSERRLETLLWMVDSNREATLWSVSENLNRTATPLTPTKVANPHRDALEDLADLLAGRKRDIVISPEVEAAVPEVQFVVDALGSLADCSVIVQHAVSQFDREPAGLVHDVETLCDLAVAARSMDSAFMRDVAMPEACRNRYANVAAGHAELLKLKAQLATMSIELETAKAQLQSLTSETERCRRSDCASTAARCARLESDSVDRGRNKLREELEAKNTFVLELLQIVKDNTAAIEELRTKCQSRKEALTLATGRLRTAETRLERYENAAVHAAMELRQAGFDRLAQQLERSLH